jgi:hypothetical protein
MKLADRIRKALSRDDMYSVVQGSGIEAMIIEDGVVKGVVAVASTRKDAQ